jgi:hypothetical protein
MSHQDKQKQQKKVAFIDSGQQNAPAAVSVDQVASTSMKMIIDKMEKGCWQYTQY